MLRVRSEPDGWNWKTYVPGPLQDDHLATPKSGRGEGQIDSAFEFDPTTWCEALSLGRQNANLRGPTQIYGTATLTALEPCQIASPDQSDILSLYYNYLIFHVARSNFRRGVGLTRNPARFRCRKIVILEGSRKISFLIRTIRFCSYPEHIESILLYRFVYLSAQKTLSERQTGSF